MSGNDAALDAMARKLEAYRLVAHQMTAQTTEHGYAATPANPDLDPLIKMAVLAEEVGEVANELCEGLTVGSHSGTLDRDALRAELVQVAAVAIAWVESLL